MATLSSILCGLAFLLYDLHSLTFLGWQSFAQHHAILAKPSRLAYGIGVGRLFKKRRVSIEAPLGLFTSTNLIILFIIMAISTCSPTQKTPEYPAKLKIILADDQPKVRSALRLLLGQETQWQVVGESGDATALLDITKVTQPDIILVDWELPGFNGKETISLLKDCCGDVKIVALSSQADAQKRARQANIDTFVSKSDLPEKVLAKLRFLETGE